MSKKIKKKLKQLCYTHIRQPYEVSSLKKIAKNDLLIIDDCAEAIEQNIKAK